MLEHEKRPSHLKLSFTHSYSICEKRKTPLSTRKDLTNSCYQYVQFFDVQFEIILNRD